MTTKEINATFTSPQKFYKLYQKQGLNFKLTVTLGKNYGSEISAEFIILLVEKISQDGVTLFQETELDSKSETKRNPSLTFSGSLLDPKNRTDNKTLIRASFNPEGEEEIFIGTGRILGEEGSRFFSRMRSQSMSSLLSLFPPSYSRTQSRRGSLMSLETLPPHYDELCSGVGACELRDEDNEQVVNKF
ncbi:hypothetical protein Fcan01_17971 [Folsomia candida]|uniref:Uncharacterized protein n=1 Tax=Folsomia candida TaxID=158441 RepID=A0A226DQ65_FOLCA|nr:hypothetical protein Fcan01_17971 [Folsomia candida]